VNAVSLAAGAAPGPSGGVPCSIASCNLRSLASSRATASPALSPNLRKIVPLPTPAAAAT
jgi:hypothetical protein